jgi:probable F420-dependent oxidoreductase
MKLGISLFNFGPGASPASLRRWVQFAEDAGFSLVMVSDHVAVTPDVEAKYPAPFFDSFTTLAWLAGITDEIELGTTVAVAPYRHPLMTARMAANIDQFSGGRLILGVGIGWAEQEYAALGVPFRRRGAITDEYLAAIRKFWTADIVSMQGEFVSFANVHTAPRPVRSPHPPIWVGGSSPAALRRAVAYGDAWHPINPRLSFLRAGLAALRLAAEAAGRPMPALCPRIGLVLRDTAMDSEERRAGEGTLSQVLESLEELANLGAAYVVLDTYPGKPADRRSATEEWRTLGALITGAGPLIDPKC